MVQRALASTLFRASCVVSARLFFPEKGRKQSSPCLAMRDVASERQPEGLRVDRGATARAAVLN